MELVGLGGEKFCGKNTAAQVLIQKYGFKEESLAKPLKELCAYVFDLDYKNWDDTTLKEKPFETPRAITYDDIYDIVRHCSTMINLETGFRKSEEQVIRNMQKKVIKKVSLNPIKPAVASPVSAGVAIPPQPGMALQPGQVQQQAIGMPRAEYKTFTTPRQILQFVGTELVRDCISPYFWCKVLDNKIRFDKKVVLTDVRFHEEREYVKIKKGLLIKIDRNTNKPVETAKPKDRHSSENSLGSNEEYNYLIRNNGTPEELQNSLEVIVNHSRLLSEDKIYKVQSKE